jgi:hypothetical protein
MESIATLYGAVEPVTRKYYGLAMKKHTPQFSQIAEVDTVEDPIRDFVEFGGPGQLSMKAENAPVTIGAIKQGPVKRVQAATFAGGIEMSREAVKDVKYKLITKAAGSLGRATALTPEYLFAQFMDRSFNSSFPVTADGVELCNSSGHILPDGTTFGNALVTPAALAESSLEDIMTALRTMPGPDGMLSPEEDKQMIVPASLHNLAEKLNRTQKTLGSNYNDVSIVAGTKVMTFDYLTNTTRWFVQTKNDNGIFWDWREKPEFIRDNIALTLQAIFVAFFRAMWGCEDPRAIFGSNAV